MNVSTKGWTLSRESKFNRAPHTSASKRHLSIDLVGSLENHFWQWCPNMAPLFFILVFHSVEVILYRAILQSNYGSTVQNNEMVGKEFHETAICKKDKRKRDEIITWRTCCWKTKKTHHRKMWESTITRRILRQLKSVGQEWNKEPDRNPFLFLLPTGKRQQTLPGRDSEHRPKCCRCRSVLSFTRRQPCT